MASQILVLTAATSEPSPTITVDPDAVTPGFGGFAIIAVLVILVFLLVWDMQRRIRRARYRDEVNDELDREQAAADRAAAAQAAAAVDSTDVDNATMDAGDDPDFARLVERIDETDGDPATKESDSRGTDTTD